MIRSFYADAHLDRADGFGSMKGRTNPHRGFDVNGWPVGTPVPALFAGTVVRSERQSGLGNVVVVQRADGTFIGYSHLDARSVNVGAKVTAGDTLGRLGNTGTLSSGPHLHVTASKVSNDPATGAVVDPLPLILQARDGVSPAAPSVAPAWNFNAAAADWKRIQRALKARGRYSGAVDGVPGPLTFKGVQATLRGVGYTGAIDGVPGPATCRYVQEYARKFGSYAGPIDSVLGAASWNGFALGLERP